MIMLLLRISLYYVLMNITVPHEIITVSQYYITAW